MDKDKKVKVEEEKKAGAMEYPIIGKSRAVEQLLKQVQLVLVLVTLGVIEQSARGQAEHADQLDQREAAAGLLAAGLRIGALIPGGVRRAGAGAVNDFDPQAMPELGGPFRARGGGTAQPG